MKKFLSFFLFAAMSSMTNATTIQANNSQAQRLESALLCQKPLSPEKAYNLVTELNGGNPQNRSDSFLGIYTVPFGFYILNQPVTEFNITRFLSDDNEYTYRYTTLLTNLSPSEAASLMGIEQNHETKQYKRGNLGIHIANGQTVLTCLFR